MCFCGSLIGACLGSCCTGCCCSGLSGCNAKHGAASRIPYIFLTFLSCIFAVVMSLYGQDALYKNNLLHISLQACNDENCQGNGSVYRTSFALFVFFMIHWIIIRWMPSFHWLFFIIKLMCFIGFLTISFWIPSVFYDNYAKFARIASLFFLLLQIVVLITWAWDVNQKLIDKIEVLEKEEKPTKETKSAICLSKSSLIGATVGINIGIIVLWALFFGWFIPNDNCNFNEFVVGFTIALVVIITVVSCYFPHASIFTSAIVCFYITYLCYAALSSYPQHDCNEFASKDNTTTTKNSGVLWIGLIITAIAISYTGFSVSNRARSLNGYDQDKHGENVRNLEEGNVNKKLQKKSTKKNNDNDNDNDNDNVNVNANVKDNDNDNDDEEGEDSEENNDNAEAVADTYKNKDNKNKPLPNKEELEKRDNLRFHLCMAFASIYMCMLYTNWGTNTIDQSTAKTRGKMSLWINLTAQWVTAILYLWTLIAPKICPQRFGMEQEK